MAPFEYLLQYMNKVTAPSIISIAYTISIQQGTIKIKINSYRQIMHMPQLRGPMSQGKMSKVDKSRQNRPNLRQVAQTFRKVAQT